MEINLKNVCYVYKNKKILDRINLKIEDNHIVGITGEYKSLLCELIDAKTLEFTGDIMYNDILLNKDNLKLIRKKVALIRQNYKDQFFTNNVLEEFKFLISRLSYQTKDINKKINQSLEMVGLDKECLNKKIDILSSGEKKLLQVAISLIYNPSVIIFDEAFVELDYTNQKRLLKLIRNLKDKYKKTVIISSNNINLLYEITNDIIILKKGKVLVSGNTANVYQNINLLRDNNIKLPDLVTFSMLAKDKKVKLSYHRDIRDLIKDVYKHV